MKKRILTIGNTNMNLNIQISSIPGPGQTAENRQFDYFAGGNGVGTAIAFNKLGCDTVYSTRLGADMNGQRLLTFFDSIGIDRRFIKTDKTLKTGFEVVLKESNGISRTLLYKGANDAFEAREIEEAFTCYPDCVYIKSDIKESSVIAASNYAKDGNVKFVCNLNDINPNFNFSALNKPSMLICNENAIYNISGIYPSDLEKCLKACIILASKVKSDYYIVRLQKRGTFIYDGKYYKIIAPYEMHVIDCSSADDAFDAALVSDYSENGNIEHAVKFAHIVYALTASKEGSYASIPTEAEVRSFMEKNKIQIN